MKVINDIVGYKNLKIVQDTQMFNFSLDSVLLPRFITLNKKIKSILDIGTGNAPIPIILTTLTSASITGVEIQKDVFDLAVESVKINKLEKQIKLINGDINDIYNQYESDSFDVITCNPPFFKSLPTSNYNDNDYKTIARHEVKLNLEQLCRISKKLLKNNGILGIVHRPERLVDIIETMRTNNIEPKRIRFIYPKHGEDANVLLIEGSKNGNPGIKILDPLYVHDEGGSYTDEVKQMFE